MRSVPSLVERMLGGLAALDAVRRSGLLHPKQVVPAAQALRTWGPTVAAGASANAVRDPRTIGLIDDGGSMTNAEIDQLSSRLANVLRSRGVGTGSVVGLLARNSRWFVLTAIALDKLGATTLYLNTGFAGPQLADVMAREGGMLLVHDDEFSPMVEAHAAKLRTVVADGEGDADLPALVAAMEDLPVGFPPRPGRQVILTSGTTGVPKGAARGGPTGASPTDLLAAAAMFDRVPLKVGMVHHIAAPMFHSLGLASLQLAIQMTQPVVLTRRFDPERTLQLLAVHEVEMLTAVPVMLQRITQLPGQVIAAHDCAALDVVFCSGSALPGSLATVWMDLFSDNLYNMYGSTEVAAASIATPSDLRAAPGTAGHPLLGVDVRLYDDADRVITDPDVDGRIFVGSSLRFDGYTSGQTKASIDGLLSSGDIGHWDIAGRLFVGGRDDDMIVSGGENLHPREVEDLLADHDEIDEVSVIGVDDDEFGKRLAAFVVLADGSDLDEASIKTFVKANLANFKVPRSVAFIDALPRNATGKVLKRELAERVS